jgi:hypothetical protein
MDLALDVIPKINFYIDKNSNFERLPSNFETQSN